MNYIDFLNSLEPFLYRGLVDYFIIILIVILSLSVLSILLLAYSEFKDFLNDKEIGRLFASIVYVLIAALGVSTIYSIESDPARLVLNLKNVKIDNKENIEFYKTIIRSPYYQKMSDSDKNAVYVATFNGIICGDEGCLNDVGEPLLVHKNFALTYAIQNLLSNQNKKINKDFGKMSTLTDAVYGRYGQLSYNGVPFEYEEKFNDFLEKTPKAVETIENAKQAYKNLEATYGSEWK